MPDETLLALCRALGSDVARPEDALEALAARRAARFESGIEPVTVVWDDARPALTLYRAADRLADPFAVTVDLDTGASFTWTHEECRVGEVRETDDGTVAVTVSLPRALPHGAHHVSVASHRRHHVATVLAAPLSYPDARTAADDGASSRRSTPSTMPTRRRATSARWGGSPMGGALRRADRRHLAAARDVPRPRRRTVRPEPVRAGQRRFWNEVYLDTSALLAAPIDEPDARRTRRPARPCGSAASRRSSRSHERPNTTPTGSAGSPTGRK